MEKETLWITTIDNPFDPFDQFDDWKRFDEDHGYYTCNYLARIAETSSGLSDDEYRDAVNRAVKEVYDMNILGIYRIVKKNETSPAS